MGKPTLGRYSVRHRDCVPDCIQTATFPTAEELAEAWEWRLADGVALVNSAEWLYYFTGKRSFITSDCQPGSP